MRKCVSPATSSPDGELSRAQGLHLSYMHWRNDTVVDVKEAIDILDSTGMLHEMLCDYDWDDGCYPDGDEIIDPNTVPDD